MDLSSLFFFSFQDALTRRPCDLFTNSHQSYTLGKAVSALLKHHPSKLSHICEQLQGRPLPSSLRPLVWSMRLQVKKNARGNIHVSKDLDSEIDTLYSEFVHSLEFGSKELGVSNVLHTPIAGVIRHTVTQAHLYRPGLQTKLVSDWHLKKAEEALNVLYVFNRSYEPQFALLVFPLIFAFHGNNHMNSLPAPPGNLVDFPYTLAFSLNLLLRNCFPTRLQVFSMADHVIQRIQQEDKELHNHLIHETKKNVSLDPHEFLVNYIHTEKEKATLAEKQMEGSSFESLPSDSTELLLNPTMFVRKWLGEVSHECVLARSHYNCSLA